MPAGGNTVVKGHNAVNRRFSGQRAQFPPLFRIKGIHFKSPR